MSVLQFSKNPSAERRWLDAAELVIVIAMMLFCLWYPYKTGFRTPLAYFGTVMVLACIAVRAQSFRDFGFHLNKRVAFSGKDLLIYGLVFSLGVTLFSANKTWLFERSFSQLFHEGSFYYLWVVIQNFIMFPFILTRLESLMKKQSHAVYATAFIFAAMHAPNLLLMVVCGLGGLLLGFEYVRTRSIWMTATSQWIIGLTLKYSLDERINLAMQVGWNGYKHFRKLYWA